MTSLFNTIQATAVEPPAASPQLPATELTQVSNSNPFEPSSPPLTLFPQLLYYLPGLE